MTEDKFGATWFDYDNIAVPTSGSPIPKLYADGEGGWLAHITRDKILMLKKFADTPPSQKAPDPENEIEIYTNPSHSFQEIEQQGPYTAIPPGDSLVWEVKWYLRKIPTQITVDINSELINFVQHVISPPTVPLLDRSGWHEILKVRGHLAELTLTKNSFIS